MLGQKGMQQAWKKINQFLLHGSQGQYEDQGGVYGPPWASRNVRPEKRIHSHHRNSNPQIRCLNTLSRCIHG